MIDFNEAIDVGIFHDSGRYTEFKTIDELRTGPVARRETILVDESIDEELRLFVETCRKAVHAILNDTRYKATMQLVYVCIALLVQKRMRPSEKYDPKRDGNIVKIGDVTAGGVCRHASILFKFICDKLSKDELLLKRDIELRCRLMRGKTPEEDHAWNIVVAGDKLYLLDVINDPTKLDPSDNENMAQYKRGNYEAQGTIGADSVHNWFNKISNVEKEKIIGSGQYSTVYKVKLRTNIGVQQVARKNIDIRLQSTEHMKDDMQMANRELNLIRYHFHNNLVPYKHHEFDVNKENLTGYLRLYMELLEMNADTYITDCKLQGEEYLREAVILILCTARGLRYIHSKGIMHRDIKPQNIMINVDPKTHEITACKVGDFGTSRKVESFMIAHTMKVGTGCFQDPKIIQTTQYSYEVDVYSLGAMIRSIVCRKSNPINISDIDMRDMYNRHPVALQLAALQSLCCSTVGRPSIDAVVTYLERILIENFIEPGPRNIFTANHRKFEYELDESIMCVKSLDKDHIAIAYRSRPDIEIYILNDDGFMRVKTILQTKFSRIWEIAVDGDRIACTSAPVDNEKQVVFFNWKTGDMLSSITVGGMISAGRSCVQFFDSKLVVCLQSGIVEVHDLVNQTKIELKNHETSAMCTVVVKQAKGRNLIITGGTDRFICVWDAETSELVQKLPCSHRVISLCVTQNMFLCGTSGGELKAWDIDTLELKCDYKLKSSFVNQVGAVGSNVVVSVVNPKGTIATTKLFNLDKKQVERDFEIREPRELLPENSKFSTVFAIHNGSLVIGGKDGVIRYFN
jgi:serine/threonine protein kinase